LHFASIHLYAALTGWAWVDFVGWTLLSWENNQQAFVAELTLDSGLKAKGKKASEDIRRGEILGG